MKQYLSGLTVTILFFGICYALFTVMSIAIHPLVTLLLGLFIGHLIGTLIAVKFGANSSLESESKETQTLYVGNLPFKTSHHELQQLFQPYGKVHSARIMIDKVTRKPRGYGFVEMDKNAAAKAINALNGSSMAGRNLKVTEANERG